MIHAFSKLHHHHPILLHIKGFYEKINTVLKNMKHTNIKLIRTRLKQICYKKAVTFT